MEYIVVRYSELTACLTLGLAAMMTLGGSPTAVAAPPMLLNITKIIKTGPDSTLDASHNLKFGKNTFISK